MVELRSTRPPENHGNIRNQQGRDQAGQVTGGFAVGVENHPLGRHPVAAFRPVLRRNLGLQLVGALGVLGEQDQGPRGVGDRQPVEHSDDRVLFGFVADDRDQVENAGPRFVGGVLRGLAQLTIAMQSPADLLQLLLDGVDVDKGLNAELGVVATHGRRQRRPSRSIRASAASGPQLPAG